MKKLIAVLLAAVLCLAFAACGGDKTTDKTVDAAAMFKALLADVTYPDNATELDSSMASVLLGGELPEGTEVKAVNVSHTLNEHGEVEVTVELLCRENIAKPSVIEEPLLDREQSDR